MKSTQPNPLVQMFEFLSRMSTAKKEKLSFSWATFATLLLAANLLGTFDVRRYVDVLKRLPEMEKNQEEMQRSQEDIKKLQQKQTHDIDEIREVLKRNKIVESGPLQTETATAFYSE